MRQHRLYIPIALLVLAIGFIIKLSLDPDLDTNILVWAKWGLPLVWALLSLVWFVFFSRFSWRTRLTGLGIALGLWGGFKAVTRVDGAVAGTGMPRYVWRWSKPEERVFAKAVEVPVAIPAPAVASAEVPQFLGPERNGILPDPGLSRDWQAKPPRELWRHSVGEGWGAFTVIAGIAITQEQRGDEEWITAYDLLSGVERWHHAERTRFTEWQGGDGPRATPTFEAGKLYVMGATGWLSCLDATTGKALWRRDTFKDHQLENITWGNAGSPLLVDGLVVVNGGKKPNPDKEPSHGTTLLAYDKATGEPRWHSGEVEPSYASPMLVTIAGKRVIMSSNAKSLTLHQPEDGKQLFEHVWGSDKMPKAAQPLLLPGDRIFLSAGYAMGCKLLQMKLEGDAFTATELWMNHKMKNQFNSCTRMGELLFGLDDGKMACLDSTTGERLWKEGRFGSGQHLLLGTDLVLIQSEPGPVLLAEVKREGFKELAKLPALSAKTWNYPTLAGKYLLVRNDREAACYELP